MCVYRPLVCLSAMFTSAKYRTTTLRLVVRSICYRNIYVQTFIHLLKLITNRSTDNTYAKQNGGKYDFLIDNFGALPLHQVGEH